MLNEIGVFSVNYDDFPSNQIHKQQVLENHQSAINHQSSHQSNNYQIIIITPRLYNYFHDLIS